MDFPKGATHLDTDEFEGLKFPHIQTRAELDEVEQANIQEGFKWLTRQRKHKNFLTQEFVRDLHLKLFGQVWEWAGIFRSTEKSIGIDPVKIPVDLQILLDDTNYWIVHTTYKREEFAARFHHRLVSIHPFPNGNGRFARIMTDVVLTEILKVTSVNWGAVALLSDNAHRENYIHALQVADKHDYSELINFMSSITQKAKIHQ